MKQNSSRREFVRNTLLASAGLSILSSTSLLSKDLSVEGKRIGIIGLDTSHCPEFTKIINNQSAGPEFAGYKVVAAYPTKGSADFPSSINRLAGFTEQVKQQGVEIVSSIEELLKKVDVVLLTAIDGRKHLELALPVLKAGKRMYIDKPFAATLSGAIAIFDAAKSYNVPVFSSSALRYLFGANEIAEGKIGKVLGADTYSPAKIEKTHTDMFWYGIHNIETLFTLMGPGCKSVVRVHTENTDMLVGTWQDGRIGSYRGTRSGKYDFGGTVFGETENEVLGKYTGSSVLFPPLGYNPLLEKITEFFRSGVAPVSLEETLEIYAFMEAADESKRMGGISVDLQTVMEKAKNSKG
jgi:predicted dehydrogenase